MLGWHASGCRLNSWSGKNFSGQNFFLVEVVENLSRHSKQLELGQEECSGIAILMKL